MDKKITLNEEIETATEAKEENIFFDLMIKVGTMGKYQLICFTIWCLSSIIGGGVIFITPYIFYQDPYQCKDPVLGSTCL